MIAGRDFLAVADALIQQPDEAEWRSAVSRAYYAAFHEARQLLRDLRFRVPRADQAHSYLWLRISNCGNLLVQRAGADLNALRSHRNRADYDVHQTLDHHDAQYQVRLAREIMQCLDLEGVCN
jgi:uncharacterized protein (UPF0332 family)